MTLIDHALASLHALWTDGPIRLSWQSTRVLPANPSPHPPHSHSSHPAPHPHRPHLVQEQLVIVLEPDSPAHIMLEAWVQNGERVRTITPRQRLRCETAHVGGMLHMNVQLDGSPRREPLLAISLLIDNPAARPVYARTSLLEQAGFTAGAYDPPCLHRLPRSRSVASA